MYDVVGNTICADLIDYIKRDHMNTGLRIALGDRFMDDFYVRRSHHVFRASRMVVRISRGAQQRRDITTELLKYLRYRYELSERVLYHHAKLAADAMLSKLLEMWGDWLWEDIAKTYRSDVVTKLSTRDLVTLKDEFAKLVPDASVDANGVRKEDEEPLHLAHIIDRDVRARIEDRLIRHSDDGLLEYLRDWAGGAEPETDRRRGAIASLATSVQTRQLYKPIGSAQGSADQSNDVAIHKRFGSPDIRREVERDAAAYAGVDSGWKVVVWVPKPGMRLKVAEVLVDSGGQVQPLDATGAAGVKDLYESHRNLWAINVYVHPDVRSSRPPDRSKEDRKRCDQVLAALTDLMGIALCRMDGTRVAPEEPAGLSCTARLAIADVCERRDLTQSDVQSLREVAAHDPSAQDLRPGRRRTHADVVRAVEQWADAEGLA